MKMFKCGCTLDGTRCDEHSRWECHGGDFYRRGMDCPPCFLERLRSVQLGAGTTPTRRGA